MGESSWHNARRAGGADSRRRGKWCRAHGMLERVQAITRVAVAKTAEQRSTAALQRLAEVEAAAAAADTVRAMMATWPLFPASSMQLLCTKSPLRRRSLASDVHTVLTKS